MEFFRRKELFTNKIGTDEVGRGPLAGPVVASSVLLLNNDLKILDQLKELKVTDSKKISEKRRSKILEKLNIPIIEKNTVVEIVPGLYYLTVEVDHKKIDEINILQASLLAMKNSIVGLSEKFKLNHKNTKAIIDGNKLPNNLPVDSEYLIKGDAKDLLIGLASIIAKEYRDTLMKEYDHKFPGYNFGKHSGYPTKEHKESIKKLGPSPIHRLSFKGVLSD